MAWAYVQGKITGSDSTTDTTIAVTMDSAVTAGNLLVVDVGWGSDTITASVAGNGNTYTSIVKNQNVSQGAHEKFYAKNVNGGATTVTVTFSSTIGFRDIAVTEYSGLDTTAPLDQSTSNIGTSTDDPSTDDASAGPVTTTTNDQLIHGAIKYGSVVNVTVVAGTAFTQRLNQQGAATVTQQAEDRLLATAGSVTALWTTTGTQNYIATLATFKLAAGGGGTPPIPASPMQSALRW